MILAAASNYEPVVFEYTKRVEPIGDDVLLQLLQESVKQIETTCTTQCSVLFHRLHERLAKGAAIPTTHDLWQIEGEALIATLIRVQTVAQEHYRYIPVMSDPLKAADALLCMASIEEQADRLKQKAYSITRLLSSKTHRSSLMFYKTQVKQIENLEKEQNPETWVRVLLKVLADTKSHKKNTTMEACTTLCDEILLHLAYACKKLREKITKEDQLLRKNLEEFIERIEKDLPVLPLVEADEEKNDRVILPTEYHFRAGKPLTSIFYRASRDQVHKLENIAKEILDRKVDVNVQIQELYRREQEMPPNTFEKGQLELAALTRRINRQQNFFTHHSLWYYRSSLLAEVEEVRIALASCEQNVLGNRRFFTQAVRKVHRFLYDFTADSLQDAIKAASSVTQKSKMSKIFKQTLATFGLRFTSQPTLRDFIKAGFLRYLHFTRQLDPELEVMIHSEGCPKELEGLYGTYLAHSDMGTSLIELDLMKSALKSLREEAATKLDFIVNYRQATQLLVDIKNNSSPHSQTSPIRIEWLRGKIEWYARMHSEQLNIEEELVNDSARELFEALTVALFTSDVKTQEAAKETVQALKRRNDFKQPAPQTILGELFTHYHSH